MASACLLAAPCHLEEHPMHGDYPVRPIHELAWMRQELARLGEELSRGSGRDIVYAETRERVVMNIEMATWILLDIEDSLARLHDGEPAASTPDRSARTGAEAVG